MHTGRHLLAWIRSWSTHGMAMGHALRMHAGVVGIACSHHLALVWCAGLGLAALSGARAVAMCAVEGTTKIGRNSCADEQKQAMGPRGDYSGEACYRARCMRTRTGLITTGTAEREDVARSAAGRRVVQKRSTKWNRVSRRKSGTANDWQVSRLLARLSRSGRSAAGSRRERDRDKKMRMKEQWRREQRGGSRWSAGDDAECYSQVWRDVVPSAIVSHPCRQCGGVSRSGGGEGSSGRSGVSSGMSSVCDGASARGEVAGPGEECQERGCGQW
jgi:hypothetical protein